MDFNLPTTKFSKTAVYAAVVVSGLTGMLNAALVVYEPFDYTAGALGSTSSSDIGFGAAEWEATGTNVYAYTTGLTFTGLTTGGGSVARPTPSGNSEMNRALSGSAVTDLTTVPSGTIYFSTLIRVNNISGNSNAGLVFGTHAVDPGVEPLGATDAGQEGFGFSVNNQRLYAVGIDDGIRSQSTGSLAVSTNNTLASTTYMIVGQIDWGATDTLTLYNVTDVNAALPASFATITGDLDESAFTTLALGDRQISNIDEIRFGTTLASVIPEPSTVMLSTIGSILLLRRRR